MLVKPSRLPLDHREKRPAGVPPEHPRLGHRPGGLRDERLDHEPRRRLDLPIAQPAPVHAIIPVHEPAEAVDLRLGAPGAEVVVPAMQAELQRPARDIRDPSVQMGRVVVQRRRDPPALKHHVPRVPVAMDDLGGPPGVAERLHAVPRPLVELREPLGRLGPGRIAALIEAFAGRGEALHRGRVGVEAAHRRRRLRAKVRREAMEDRQRPTGRAGLALAPGIRLARDILEELVEPLAEMEDGVVLVARAKQPRERVAARRQMQLKLVAEGDALELFPPAARGPAPLEEQRPPARAQERLGRVARAALDRPDLRDDARVIVRERDRQLEGLEPRHPRARVARSGHHSTF